jgi:hypothetical protein
MAKKKDKKMWIGIALLAVVGGAIWFMRKKTPALLPPGTPPLPGGTPLPGGAIPIVPGTGAALTPTTTPLVPTQANTAIPTDPRVATIQTWANTSMTPPNLAQFNKMKSSFTNDDWLGLFDLYFNDWIGGQGNTAARTVFWNGWRSKYHINDGTF